MKNSLTNGQLTVLQAFHEFGPMTDMALTVYVHHTAGIDMSSSGIRTRRSELQSLGYVQGVGTRKLKSGRHAAVHALTGLGQQEASKLFKAVSV